MHPQPRHQNIAIGFAVVDDENARRTMHGLGQELSHFSQELTGTVRLAHVGIAAGLACLGFVAGERIGRHHDDRDRFRWPGPI